MDYEIGHEDTIGLPITSTYSPSWTSEESQTYASQFAESGSVDEDEIQMIQETKEVDLKNNPKNIIWGATSDELAKAHESTLVTLKPMPSGIEGPRQIITLCDLPYTKAEIESISVARPQHCLPGIMAAMNINEQPVNRIKSASADKTWNLFETQDGILTADQWYNFETNQARQDRDVLEKQENAADRINREGGMK